MVFFLVVQDVSVDRRLRSGLLTIACGASVELVAPEERIAIAPTLDLWAVITRTLDRQAEREERGASGFTRAASARMRARGDRPMLHDEFFEAYWTFRSPPS
jgi:hypothetical protein